MMRVNGKHVWTTGLALLALAAEAAAQNRIVFDSSNCGSGCTIGCDDLQYEGYDVEVRGVTLTIDCAHTFNSLTVTSNGTVTHGAGNPEGMKLTILGEVRVDYGSVIHANAKGHEPAQGPGAGGSGANGANGGGGAYGGAGSDGNDLGASGGGCYGSFLEPADLGSGGGNSGQPDGGRGGGLIRLDVGGSLALNGDIRANGGNATDSGGGGGSGGSIWITANAITGTGVISANGGSYGYPNGGGGGGGRVALYAPQDDFDGFKQAFGGPGGYQLNGGCGTIYTKSSQFQHGELLIDNNNVTNQMGAEFTGTAVFPCDVKIDHGGLISHPRGIEGLHLFVQGDLIIYPSSGIDASGRGYTCAEGPGAGGSGAKGANGGGGAHGGAGSDGSAIGAEGGNCYGSFLEPTDMGSGGGNAGGPSGGAGGGAVRITVEGSITINGWIRANGGNATGSGGGGGSGGSIWITANAITGTGVISANGGSYGYPNGGGGGGGRVALYAPQDDFDGFKQAFGGPGGYQLNGGCGTIYTKSSQFQHGELLIDNNGVASQMGAEFTGEVEIDGSLRLTRSGLLSQPHGTGQVHIRVSHDVYVEGGSAVSVKGRGYAPASGPGAGGSGAQGANGGGGGYGGQGGDGRDIGADGGVVYGEAMQPTDMGSGGGNAGGPSGGPGGGSMKLTVGGTIALFGELSANGGNATGAGGGGGSGGSLWISANAVTGTGVISADGGSYGYPNSGGGGGGRIAVEYCSLTLAGDRIHANGGSGGWQNGQPGTIHLERLPGCGGRRRVTSSGEARALAFGGSLIQLINRANQSPPPIDEGWSDVYRKNENLIRDGFRCDCSGFELDCCEPFVSPDPLAEAFVSANEYIEGADEVTLDNCGSAFYRFPFDLPPNALRASLRGSANVDDQAVLYLNGRQVSGTLNNPDCNPDGNLCDASECYAEQDCFQEDPLFDLQDRRILTWPVTDDFLHDESADFSAGPNALVFAVVGDASFFEPTGVEFEAEVTYDLEVDCGQLIELTAQCKPDGDTYKLSAKLSTALPEGWELNFSLDGDSSGASRVNTRGKAKAKWKGLAEGNYDVCVAQCSDMCARARCRP